jgi:hypothetical protein
MDLMDDPGAMGQSMLDTGVGIGSITGSRMGMHHKDVAKRVPELAEAFGRLERGEITAMDYDALVNVYKPITPYTALPPLATEAEMRTALRPGQKPKINVATGGGEIPASVALRLDIPSYTKSGTWVPTMHDATSSKMPTISHDPYAVINNATFDVPEARAIAVASGRKPKNPFATIPGEYEKLTQGQVIKEAQDALADPTWSQVGMDPERHSYFYNRVFPHNPIGSADRVIQMGPLVLAKNAKPPMKGGKPLSKTDFFYSMFPTLAASGLLAPDEDLANKNYGGLINE